MGAVTDPINRFYTGMHFYFNSWSVSGAITQMNYGINAGCKIINTEIGADSNEEGAFSQSEVDEVTQFMAWCADTEHRIVGNCVWQRYGLQNYDTYQLYSLVWPDVPSLPESVYYTITASSDGNSTIDPTGAVQVLSGSNKTFTFTADGGYVIDSVTVDSEAVAVTATYNFYNVVAAHTIAITAAAGAPPSAAIAAISVSRMLNGE